MNKNRFQTFIAIGGMLVCMACAWLTLPTYLFYQAEQQADSKFDALNESVLAEIPPPEGVVMIEKITIGGSNTAVHGKHLFITYKMGNLTSLDVINHYQDLLLPNQWKSYRTEAMDKSYYTFIKESACIDLMTFESGEYIIDIWHDIWSQSFSPPKPNMFSWNMLEFGKGSFSVCNFEQ